MRAFYLVSCLAVAAVMARPEPPLYQGLQQQNRRALLLNGNTAEPHVYQQLPQEQSFANFAVPVPTYNNPDTLPSNNNMALGAPIFSTVEMLPQQDSYNVAYQHSASQSHASGYNDGPTQVHKHIYVHIPPKDFEEDDAQQPHVTHQAGPKQKHYKIVFIKAPSAPAIRTPIVPPAPLNEEKTLIYVLHKKPEAHPDIVIPTAAPTKPSKPEVFFIKYKTKKEEAPVYGPPPAQIQARQGTDATDDFPMENEESNNLTPMNLSQYEMVATTQSPTLNEQEQPPQQQQSQFIQQGEISNEPNAYSASSMSVFNNEESQPSAAEPLNQYLSPETTATPIVVEEIAERRARAPSVSYGPPTRYFFKKRK